MTAQRRAYTQTHIGNRRAHNCKECGENIFGSTHMRSTKSTHIKSWQHMKFTWVFQKTQISDKCSIFFSFDLSTFFSSRNWQTKKGTPVSRSRISKKFHIKDAHRHCPRTNFFFSFLWNVRTWAYRTFSFLLYFKEKSPNNQTAIQRYWNLIIVLRSFVRKLNNRFILKHLPK